MENNKSSSDTSNYRSMKIKPIDDNPIETLASGVTRFISQEIIEEILVRLSVKSLLKLRCVSKSWLSLISSPKFVKSHLKFSTLDPIFTDYRLMLRVRYDPVHNSVHNGSVSSAVRDLVIDAVDDGPIEDTEWEFRINGSCDGLLCVSVFRRGIHAHYDPRNLNFIWNPSMRISKKFPPATALETGLLPTYGTGYDEANDDYKVAGIFWYFCKVDDRMKLGVKIYSLKKDSWKNAVDDVKSGVLSSLSSVIFSNGRFHFVLICTHSHSYARWNILSVGLADDEVCGTIEQPIGDDCSSGPSIGILQGCISALCNYSRDHADVWVLREYGVRESWTKLVRIPYAHVPHLKDYFFDYHLCILSNGKYLLGRGRQLVVYDPQDNSFRYPRSGNVVEICSTGIYVESLVTLPI